MKVLTRLVTNAQRPAKNRVSQKLTIRLNCKYIPLKIYFKANAILCNNSQGFCNFAQLSSLSLLMNWISKFWSFGLIKPINFTFVHDPTVVKIANFVYGNDWFYVMVSWYCAETWNKYLRLGQMVFNHSIIDSKVGVNLLIPEIGFNYNVYKQNIYCWTILPEEQALISVNLTITVMKGQLTLILIIGHFF